MNQYLYKLHLNRPQILTEGPTPTEAETLDQHQAHLQNLVSEGTVLLAGRTQVSNADAFGIVIFLATSEAQANDIMNNDPAVKAGLMSAELFPYQIAMLSNDIVRLSGH